ncbi:DUF7824 domain-containing protein [Microtetraspora niveoalba]|uniref:DUF7824 domain-containing protein n=1 Tax=Microtetraspora niveoalba TaxID=46175 RepID=UPI00082BA0DA|nr:DUF6493 family protein [Microtetraspora niveoalba]
MTPWQDVAARIVAGDAAGTLRLVTGLDAAGRRAVAAELPRHLAELKRTRDGWWEWHKQIPALRVAGAVCLPGPTAVANWLYRRDFSWRDDHVADAGRILGVLRRRPEPWRAELARRMVERLRAPQVGAEIPHWRIAASLVRETGIEPPANDALVIGWLRSLGATGHGAGRDDLERVTGDPLFGLLLPRVFEADGLGTALFGAQIDVIGRMVDEGLLDRAEILDRVIGRLLADGSSALPALAELHDRLAPTPDEVAERATDYVRLLPAAPPVVAETALARLRLLDAEGRLEVDMFAEAAEALAFRAERKIVLPLAGWIVDAVRRVPDRAAAGLAALCAVFGQDALPLQERAVRAALTLASYAGERERAAVREAAADLPVELREKIAAEYGEVAVKEAAPPPPALVAVTPPAPPAPIASPAELVREIGDLSWSVDAARFERLLAGLVEWTHRDPVAVREALDPSRERLAVRAFGSPGMYYRESAYTLLCRAALAAAAPEECRGRAGRARRYGDSPHPIDGFLMRRAREVAEMFEAGGTRPVLLATPTSGTGHVAPRTLVARLESLEAAGAEPLPADFAQALLRLPRAADPAAAVRARRLSSPSGREPAVWIERGGLPDPVVSCEIKRHRERSGELWYGEVRARIVPPGADLPPPVGELFTRDPAGRRAPLSEAVGWWPAVLPSHREVAAAHMIEVFQAYMESTDGQVEALSPLAHGDGPTGAGTAYALVVGMGHTRPVQRAAATDALIALAARGDVPAAEIGRAVDELVRAGFVKLNRVTSVLDDAARAGAHAEVWEIVAAALPGLLPEAGEKPRANLADLLAVGARAAEPAGARTAVPGLAAVAEREGTSRFVLEARRLHRRLTS